MTMDNTIDVDAVLDANIERSRINRIDIMDAVFMRDDGKAIKVTQKERRDFKFTGLCYSYWVPVIVARESERKASNDKRR